MAKSKKPGRPPKGSETMLNPVTIRLPKALDVAIDRIVEENALAGADKSSIIRELLAEAVRRRAAETKKR